MDENSAREELFDEMDGRKHEISGPGGWYAVELEEGVYSYCVRRQTGETEVELNAIKRNGNHVLIGTLGYRSRHEAIRAASDLAVYAQTVFDTDGRPAWNKFVREVFSDA